VPGLIAHGEMCARRPTAWDRGDSPHSARGDRICPGSQPAVDDPAITMSLNAGLAARRAGEDFVTSTPIQLALTERRRASVARALRLTRQEDPPIEYVVARSGEAVGPTVARAESAPAEVRHQT
jgi:hypothetical protein